MSGFLQDLSHGARMLLKSPGFALVAIISIAIGVGANAAMFSVADGLVIRPLPVPRPGEIVTIRAIVPDGIRNNSLSYPEFLDVRTQSHSFSSVVAYTLCVTSFVDRPDDPAQRRVGLAVSSNHFDAAGLTPALGRWFRPEEDDAPGRDAVVVLDYDEWRERFGADPQIVDRRLRVGGVDFTVVGVAPPGFSSLDHDLHPAFYIPLAMVSAVQSEVPADTRTRREVRNLVVKGRLKPGVSVSEAREDVQQIARNLAREYPDTNRDRDLTALTQFAAFTDGPGRTDATIVGMLVTLAFVVLIVACANVAGLLTSRAPVRAREVALRLAVGAARGRIVRQLVTESLLIAVGGGLLGLLFGYGVIALFQRIEYATDLPLKLTFALDTRVVFVGALLAAASALLSGLVPAWQATRADLVSIIKAPAGNPVKRQRLWGRSLLVGGQIALSLVLITVASFLYRAFQGDLDKGPGFRTDRILTLTFEPGLARYDDAQRRSFYRTLKDTVASAPGVAAVSLVSAAPMKAGDIAGVLAAPEGFVFPRGARNVGVPSINVDENYFSTLDIPIVSGRAFRATDTPDAPRVAVVNQTFANRYWPGQSAVGKRIRLFGPAGGDVEVVGVAHDAKYFFVVESPLEFVYLPHMQGSTARSTLLVGTTDAPAALASRLREMVRAIDPNMPIFGVRTLDDFYLARVVYTSHLIIGVVAGMGGMGLVLALVGLYGLVSYNARRRTREIGIRVAVGASPRRVRQMVLRHGCNLAVGGIVVGLIASAAANNLLRAAFAQTVVMSATVGNEVGVYVQAVTGVIVVVLLAAYLPARRAARVDPLIALRTE